MRLKIGFIGVGMPSFDINYAKKHFFDSVDFLTKKFEVDIVLWRKEIIENEKEGIEVALFFEEKKVDVLFVQFSTFALGNILAEFAKRLKIPFLLWSLRDKFKEDGRLLLNSFCGVNLASAVFKRLKKNDFKFVYGNPFERRLEEELRNFIKANGARKALENANLGLIGSRVPGFFTSNFDELGLMKKFGVNVKYIDLIEVKKEKEDLNLLEVKEEIKRFAAKENIEILIDQDSLHETFGIQLALEKIIEKYNLKGIALKCWPEFQTFMNIVPCVSVGNITEKNFPISCEADMEGLISMIIGRELSKYPPVLLDLAFFDEQRNSAIFWHCGCAPPCLRAETEKICLNYHPMMNIPSAFDFKLKKGKITVFRVSREIEKSGYRLLVIEGEGMVIGKKIRGNGIEVLLNQPLDKFLDVILNEGIEHHYVLSFGGIKKPLLDFSKLMDIRVLEI